MMMTPRRIFARQFMARQRKQRGQYQLLALIALGSSGDTQTIKRQLADWEAEF